MNAQQQIRKEYQEITRNPMAAIGFSVGLPDENNIFEWRCTLMGPQDSPYKGGLFYLKVLFPVDYPQTKPEVRFITPIYPVHSLKPFFKELQIIIVPHPAFGIIMPHIIET